MNQHNKQASRTALVTGAARRIGAEIAKHLHQAGFNVLLHYHQSKDEAETLANQLNQLRRNSARAITANLCHKEHILGLIKEAIQWQGRLDLLVNNAAVFKRSEEACWDDLFQLNLKAPYDLSYAAYPHLAEVSGVIINITDRHAETPLKAYAMYCQSKAALSMQTKALAREFAPKVRVNAVAPGAIAWPEGDNVLSGAKQEEIIARTPLKQHGKPLYIAQAVLALIENPFITGQSLIVDGGRGLT